MDLQLLNAQDHGRLRLGPLPAAGPHFVQIVPSEFVAAAAVCPVFLTKNADTGQFYAGAMFGFEPGESLVGVGETTQASFTPLDLERQGVFLTDGGVIAVDRDHPRFVTGQGAPLFDAQGEPTAATRRLQHVLAQLQAGVAESERFIQGLLALKLIEPIDIDLSFDDGRSSLNGLYTVSLDALSELDDAAALRLFRRGDLQLVYAMSGSLRQVSALAKLRNDKLAA